MSSSPGICVAFANVAGGRMVDAGGEYVDADRTADFGATLGGMQPDVLIVTELNCDDDQLDRLAAAAMPGQKPHLLRHDFSDSHIPGADHPAARPAGRRARASPGAGSGPPCRPAECVRCWKARIRTRLSHRESRGTR